MWARSDVIAPYNFNENILIRFFLENKSITLIDVGANLGEWSEGNIKILREAGIDYRIFVFEPCEFFYKLLIEKFSIDENIFITDLAVADKNSISKFYFSNPPVATSSLIFSSNSQSCDVKTISLDSWLSMVELEQIDIVKTDVEGCDFNVLKGAAKALMEGRVGVWMFEYNHRWIDSRSYLKDVFDFIADKPYSLAKIGKSLQIYNQWNQELDRFFEANFVLIRNDLLGKIEMDVIDFDFANSPNVKSAEVL